MHAAAAVSLRAPVPALGRARPPIAGKRRPLQVGSAIAPSPASVDADRVRKDENECVVNTYGRTLDAPVFTHGLGCKMWDTEGKEYLDFCAGIAVNCLGHCDPDWVAAVTEQANKLCHVSNLYHTEPGATLAQLVDTCFADRVFYCNSGTEANEGAIRVRQEGADDEGQSRRSGRHGVGHGDSLLLQLLPRPHPRRAQP